MIRDVAESFGEAVVDRAGRLAGRAQERRPLPADVLESDDAYLVVFDAPDATAAAVRVRFADGSVRVRIDRTRELREGFEMRFPGRGLTLDGRVDLPDDAVVEPESATATLADTGVLRVKLPKTTRAPAGGPGTDERSEDDGDDGVVDALDGDDPAASDDETDGQN